MDGYSQSLSPACPATVQSAQLESKNAARLILKKLLVCHLGGSCKLGISSPDMLSRNLLDL